MTLVEIVRDSQSHKSQPQGHKFTTRNTYYSWCSLDAGIQYHVLYLTPPPRGTPENMSIYLIFLATRIIIIRLHFAADSMDVSSLKFFMVGSIKLLFLQEGRSRSSKVIDFGMNRKCVCDFLLVRHSNLGPILHHFGDIADFLCSWPHPYSTLILECSRRTKSPMLGSVWALS